MQALRSAEDMAALASEWNELAARCPGYFLSQTFHWADAAWRTVVGPRGVELLCLMLRDGARLAGMWPLVVRRDRGLRIVSPLGGDAGEHSAPLVEPGEAKEWKAFTYAASSKRPSLTNVSRSIAE